MSVVDKSISTYSDLISRHLENYGINGQMPDQITLQFLSYGEIVFQSYKFKKLLPRKAYCGLFKMGGDDYLMMFTDLEDEGIFKGLVFTYSMIGEMLAIEHEELGKFVFKKS
jgi:hypothetical protein